MNEEKINNSVDYLVAKKLLRDSQPILFALQNSEEWLYHYNNVVKMVRDYEENWKGRKIE